MNRNPKSPPRFADFLLEWFCNDHVIETLQGDLHELYQKRRATNHKWTADLHYFTDVLSALRPFALKKRTRSKHSNNIMLGNHLKIAFRNITKNKVYSTLNISGLAIGMTCSILILLWVHNELSYDKFHKDADSIYRITVDAGGGFKAAVNPAGMPPGLKDEMPEIKSYLRLTKPENVLVEIGERSFEEPRTFFIDSNFLQFFSFELLKGDPKTALSDPQSAIITEDVAIKYFGDEDPLGKVIRINTVESLTVTGVLANVPSNSHLKYNLLIPMAVQERYNRDLQQNVWDTFNFYSYLKFDGEAVRSQEQVEQLRSDVNRIFKSRVEDFPADFILQSLTDIHLHSDYQIDLPGHGNIQYVNSLFVIAIIILIAACLNFMNLATARYEHRAREVGLRKVIGARRSQLISQFLTESLMVSAVSFSIAMVMAYLSLPYFSLLSDKSLAFELDNSWILFGLISIAILTGLIAGSYPAFFLSGFEPIKTLTGKLKIGKGNKAFRNTLVVIQLGISVTLLIGAIVTHNQLTFIQKKNLGFDKSNLMYMPTSGELRRDLNVLRNRLSQNSLTENYTIISDLPTDLITGTVNYDWKGKDPNLQTVIPDMRVDENFLNVFDIELISGRTFSNEMRSDSNNFIINEKMAELMGMGTEEVIGQSFTYYQTSGKIIGVVKDFNFKPLQYSIEPLVLRRNFGGGLIVVKTSPGVTQETISVMEEINTELNPLFPFSFNFVDQDLDNLYQGEQRMGYLFKLFTMLAIIISCLGLYGLANYVAESHTKEIGIRKALGASTSNLVRVLFGGFLRLVGLALIISIPIGWYTMEQWLADFTYRIDLQVWFFVTAAFGALALTIISAGYQILKAALSNPVNSLRSE